jgi:hypothetical protein
MGQMRMVLGLRMTGLGRKTGLQMGLEIQTLEVRIRPASSLALVERSYSAAQMKTLAQLKSCLGRPMVDPSHLWVGSKPWRWFGRLGSHRRRQPVRFE